MGELEILERAHRLFAADSAPVRWDTEVDYFQRTLRPMSEPNAGSAHLGHRRAVAGSRITLRAAADTDVELAAIISDVQRDHRAARELTGRVLQEARVDAATPPVSPLAQREALRRRVARLRTQHEVVSTARRRALRRAALLRLLRYRARRRGARRLRRVVPPPGRAGAAVRAALSRLGTPYVWGATGPNQFDCSGLVQWAYHQAGVPLHRTTYDQIHDGIAVSRSQVRPGDLVFPHAGHVQMAIGNGLVVEAPYAGATVRISRLGDAIAIRRPG